MVLEMSPATQADARRIAEIHMAAFEDNAMLRAQFPTNMVREALQRSVELKASADIDDTNITVLIVRDLHCQCKEKDNVIAFAKWSHPILDTENYVEAPWIWPDGTDEKILAAWTKKTEEAFERAVGAVPCYRLTFIGTDPSHERRGAGSLLVGWGMERSRADHAPIYLESTLEAAPFYRHLGFAAGETVSLQLSNIHSYVDGLYEEIVFTLTS
ncbi:putative GNAT family acetyltransferase [Hypoxylon crocopeplum]|nr:putative GNAT family acetyltransferase [Hypoxylon crocopeplum]